MEIDPQTGVAHSTAANIAGRQGHVMVTLSNSVILIGFGVNGRELNDFWSWNPATATVQQEFV